MAKTVRKRTPRATSTVGGKADNSRANKKDDASDTLDYCSNQSTLDCAEVPAIQQFQDLIDMQKEDFENIRVGLSQQNLQLARSNSGLMVKIREMDTSVSELIQENVGLRSKLSMKDSQLKQRLEETISTLERGVFQRMDEILHMFASVRQREGIEAPAESLLHRSAPFNEPRSILKRNRSSHPRSAETSHIGHRSSVATIAFNELQNEVFSPEHNSPTKSASEPRLSPAPKKRRKSSRRESLFHPSDFEFSDNSDHEESSAKAPEPTAYIGTTAPPLGYHGSSNQNEVDVPTEADTFMSATPPEPIEDVCNFTNSLIEYSIPEEIPERAVENSIVSDTSSKLPVYHDSVQDTQTETTHILPDSLQNSIERAHVANPDSHKSSFKSSMSSQEKVKHSMRSRGSQKKMIDEVMPTSTCGSTSELSDTSRTRRTRGKAINYAQPSLRAKMRRPTEKLVDATTVTNFRDMQVEGNRRKSRSGSRDGTPFIEDSTKRDSAIPASHETTESENKNTEKKNDPEPQKLANPAKIDMNPPTIPKLNPLKDITNNAPAKSSMKTKKLFRKAIVGDLGSENSCSLEDSSGNRSTSFRVNEEDLSVFDLLDDLKTSSAPRTHRARAREREEAGKRSRKTAFRL
ncbi:LADA_0A01288g1_1 [Lachancea dasiensis]|uniref:LADA_0A01288g1_1 n=1 Tax=Lachancea dasiensis TaxID=1072105 RepID=A0A1G4ILW8_9SACH|nr:LADA_0A01288g1_1 [Lachancea dasiensis]